MPAALGRRGQAVAPHHRSDRCAVRRATGCGLHDGSYFAEVVWPEDAGSDDCQNLRVARAKVVEAVDRDARYAKALRPRRSALASVTVQVSIPASPYIVSS